MIHFKKILCVYALAAFFALYISNAHARTALDDPFKDYISLSNYMKSQGLSTSINWEPIEELCMGLMESDDRRVYNQCKFEKARMMIMHGSDREQCEIRAEGVYPDSLNDARIDTLREIGPGGLMQSFERTTPPISNRELKARRYGAIVECMQGFGWNNANNWTLGKRSACNCF